MGRRPAGQKTEEWRSESIIPLHRLKSHSFSVRGTQWISKVKKGTILAMKKNLLSVLVLALVLVNVILSAVMMFSVLSTNRKTAALVTSVASILSMEL